MIRVLESTLEFEWQGEGKKRRKVYRYSLKQRGESQERIKVLKEELQKIKQEI